ncbi:helix-turn-helix transcriptional regulator [Streptacidiphilus sp. 4-A2]|nr:helix-turn-helix transcriptional regulator [Streptacidiphilus sp. 4-A2]
MRRASGCVPNAPGGAGADVRREQLASAGIALADADGLGAVTMRAVAQALGAGPASLYRYVATREELLELMIDQAVGEMDHPATGPGPGSWLDGLLGLARQSRELYLRHPWLLDATASRSPWAACRLPAGAGAGPAGGPPGLPGAKLEALGVFHAVVAALSRAEADQRRAGRTLPQWQQAQQEYLTRAVSPGSHPHLAAALAGAARTGAREPAERVFDRVVTRVLTGLLHQSG